MQGAVPSWAWVRDFLALAAAQDLIVYLKSAMLLCILAALVFLGEKAAALVLTYKRSRNGGTGHAQLKQQTEALTQILRVVESAAKQDGDAHAEMISVSKQIRAATEDHALTTDTMFRALMGKLDKGHE